MKFNRIFLVVMDSVGIGEAKDERKFNDENTNTVKHIIEKTKIELPNLRKLGLYNLIYHTSEPTIGSYGRAEEISNGKDTLTGHLEMMGVETKVPFQTFLDHGFPEELIHELEEKSGRKIIGNCVASGTEIIERLGKQQMETGALIVYTSADSVLQIAAHEDIIPVSELYHICEIARELTLKEEWKVGRVIARPYTGVPGNFIRTAKRHDYALNPAHKTVLDALKEKGYEVISIGKISDIFNQCGITKSTKIEDNVDGIHKIIETIQTPFTGLCFANLNDFDSKYGHRRDAIGYGKALAELDHYIPEMIEHLNDSDLLLLVADHGNDPTYTGTDHTRENIPVLAYSKKGVARALKPISTFGNIGATIADNFQVTMPTIGVSFLEEL